MIPQNEPKSSPLEHTACPLGDFRLCPYGQSDPWDPDFYLAFGHLIADISCKWPTW